MSKVYIGALSQNCQWLITENILLHLVLENIKVTPLGNKIFVNTLKGNEASTNGFIFIKIQRDIAKYKQYTR